MRRQRRAALACSPPPPGAPSSRRRGRGLGGGAAAGGEAAGAASSARLRAPVLPSAAAPGSARWLAPGSAAHGWPGCTGAAPRRGGGAAGGRADSPCAPSPRPGGGGAPGCWRDALHHSRLGRELRPPPAPGPAAPAPSRRGAPGTRLLPPGSPAPSHLDPGEGLWGCSRPGAIGRERMVCFSGRVHGAFLFPNTRSRSRSLPG